LELASAVNKVFIMAGCRVVSVGGEANQRLAAKQENYNNDEEQEADRTAANIVKVGKHGQEQWVHRWSFSLGWQFISPSRFSSTP
jgi:hypothetical protein